MTRAQDMRPGAAGRPPDAPRPTRAQRHYLSQGLDQPGGKLPLFDTAGQAVAPALIRACIGRGWAAPWFANPIKPDWLVCRLTEAGRLALGAGGPASDEARLAADRSTQDRPSGTEPVGTEPAGTEIMPGTQTAPGVAPAATGRDGAVAAGDGIVTDEGDGDV
ncbi:hypothetical protein [Rhodothalassium salexigens]|uniref:hypothetical protein n=1 Tax=Rhodothalassium salexigens TaxID=1086 RepID=UPI001912C494|nr:hypothetical protein [Rhodothalassium salexigens]